MKCFVSFNNKHLKKKAKRKSCVCLRQFEHFVLIKCLFLFAVILMLQQCCWFSDSNVYEPKRLHYCLIILKHSITITALTGQKSETQINNVRRKSCYSPKMYVIY